MFMLNNTLPKDIQLEAYKKRFAAGLDKKMKSVQRQKEAKKSNALAKALMAGSKNYLNQQ